MDKVPVWRTIGGAIAFTIEHFLPILGAIWLPLAILGVCQYFLLAPMVHELAAFAKLAAQHRHGPLAPPQFLMLQRFAPGLDVLALVVGAWLRVGVTKEALGLRRGPKFVYVPTDLAELRLIGAYFVLLAIFVAVAVAVFLAGLAGGIVGGALAAGGALDGLHWETLKPWGGWLIVAGVTIVVAVVIYFLLRMVFFLVPVTVAEKRFGLWRSWELSRGNVGRIFVVSLVMFVMILVLEIAVVAALAIPAIFAISQAFPHGGFGQHAPVDIDVAIRVLAPYLTGGFLVLFAIYPVLLGFALVPPALAYRALVPEDSTE